MTNFDLLPLEYRKKPATVRRILLIIIIIILSLVIIKYAFYVPIQNKKVALQQLNVLRRESEAYTDLDETLLIQKSYLEELEQRIVEFQEMEEGLPQYWKDVLETFINCLPQNVSLNQFTCDNNTIILTGHSLNDKSSATYLRNLSESNFFSEVNMIKIIYEQNDEVHFTIQCILDYDSKIDSVGRDTP